MQKTNPNKKKEGVARPARFRSISFRVQPTWIALLQVFLALLLAAVVAMPDVLVAVTLYLFGLLLVIVIIYRSEWILERLIARIKRDAGKQCWRNRRP